MFCITAKYFKIRKLIVGAENWKNRNCLTKLALEACRLFELESINISTSDIMLK